MRGLFRPSMAARLPNIFRHDSEASNSIVITPLPSPNIGAMAYSALADHAWFSPASPYLLRDWSCGSCEPNGALFMEPEWRGGRAKGERRPLMRGARGLDLHPSIACDRARAGRRWGVTRMEGSIANSCFVRISHT